MRKICSLWLTWQTRSLDSTSRWRQRIERQFINDNTSGNIPFGGILQARHSRDTRAKRSLNRTYVVPTSPIHKPTRHVLLHCHVLFYEQDKIWDKQLWLQLNEGWRQELKYGSEICETAPCSPEKRFWPSFAASFAALRAQDDNGLLTYVTTAQHSTSSTATRTRNDPLRPPSRLDSHSVAVSRLSTSCFVDTAMVASRYTTIICSSKVARFIGWRIAKSTLTHLSRGGAKSIHSSIVSVCDCESDDGRNMWNLTSP